MNYGYDVALYRLEKLESREDADSLIEDYAAALTHSGGRLPVEVRELLDAGGHGWAVGALDRAWVVEMAKKNLGWLLGELSPAERTNAIAHLPEDVEHPLTGRRTDKISIAEAAQMGAEWMRGTR